MKYYFLKEDTKISISGITPRFETKPVNQMLWEECGLI